MDETKLAELERRARGLENVAPGPWKPARDMSGFIKSQGGGLVATAQTIEARDYIAAAGPDVILDMLDERSRLLSAMEKTRQRADGLDDDNESLKADNAALLVALGALQHVESRNPEEGMVYCPTCSECESGHTKDCKLAAILFAPHPGAALLEELRALRGECEAARQGAAMWSEEKAASDSARVVWRKENEALRARVATLEAELASLRASMEPTRLERPDPTTLEEALAALRLWRGGARDANQRALENYRRADLAERQRDAAQAALRAALDATAMATSEMERVTRERDHWHAQAIQARPVALREAARMAQSEFDHGEHSDQVRDMLANVATAILALGSKAPEEAGEQDAARRAVVVLNEALHLDRKAVADLLVHRVPCNEALGRHPSVQVRRIQDGLCTIGALGLINGLFGAISNGSHKGWGRIVLIAADNGDPVRFELTPTDAAEPHEG